MSHYRLYCLDRASHIVQQATFEAPDDAQAIACVGRYDARTDRELWHDHRKVIVIPAQPDLQPQSPHMAVGRGQGV